uniref:Uncharacterized protein n=1 Tax=Quercus lobata TaxID=97700 RepID=A0A7N2M2X2_QUELO
MAISESMKLLDLIFLACLMFAGWAGLTCWWSDVWRNHVGVRLQPPVGADRTSQLGKWEEKEVKVSGMSWDVNSIDIAVAGLGWFALGLKGEATLALLTYDGIEITLREPLALDRAPFLERPGFWQPNTISDASGTQTKLKKR